MSLDTERVCEKSSITISKRPNDAWKDLIKALGLDRGQLELMGYCSSEKPFTGPPTDNMCLEIRNGYGKPIPAKIILFDPHIKLLKIGLYSDNDRSAEPIDLYEFKVEKSGIDEAILLLTNEYNRYKESTSIIKRLFGKKTIDKNEMANGFLSQLESKFNQMG